MKVKIGEQDIYVRVVQGRFLRIFGLTDDQRQRLRVHIERSFFKNFKNNEVIITRYDEHGRLEVEDLNIAHYPYEKSVVFAVDLQMRMVELVKKFFAVTE